jgi:hypothetical protein
VCGDDNSVLFVYTVKTAEFDGSLAALVAQKFNKLHSFNLGPVFSSLFSQTIAEIRMSHFIFSFAHGMSIEEQS